MKVKYVGESFGIDELTNGKIYECLGVEYGMLRVIDDSEEDYLYSSINPGPLDRSSPGGEWEIIEDDEKGTLKKQFAENEAFIREQGGWKAYNEKRDAMFKEAEEEGKELLRRRGIMK